MEAIKELFRRMKELLNSFTNPIEKDEDLKTAAKRCGLSDVEIEELIKSSNNIEVIEEPEQSGKDIRRKVTPKLTPEQTTPNNKKKEDIEIER